MDRQGTKSESGSGTAAPKHAGAGADGGQPRSADKRGQSSESGARPAEHPPGKRGRPGDEGGK